MSFKVGDRVISIGGGRNTGTIITVIYPYVMVKYDDVKQVYKKHQDLLRKLTPLELLL